jgi:large subunit ribosomal protein L18
MKNLKQIKRVRRHAKIRSKVAGTEMSPRLSVFKSNKYVYAQLINDDTSTTLVSATSLGLESKTKKAETAFTVGKMIAEKALAKGVKKVVFDRGGFIFAGAIKALAEGAREGGLQF